MGASSSKWYIAVVVIEIRVEGEEGGPPLVDAQYKLLRAEDPESAYQRALDLAANEELEYDNDDGSRVNWRCAGLHDLRELSEPPVDGAEVYSWMDRADPSEWVVSKDQLTVFVASNPA